MVNSKLLLGMAIVSIIYTGCNEKEANSVTEEKLDVKVEKVEPKPVAKTEPIVEKAETPAPLIEKAKEIITPAPLIEKVQKIVTTPDVSAIYKKCAGCHGLNGEKKALNKSEIIKNWDASKIESALKGYKDGTYGGTMKGLMKSQVSSLSDKEISELAQYITTLNK